MEGDNDNGYHSDRDCDGNAEPSDQESIHTENDLLQSLDYDGSYILPRHAVI